MLKKDKTEKSKTSKLEKVSLTFAILEINVEDAYVPIRLFKDPNFKDGYYTLENISPELISPIIKLELDNDGNIIKKEQK